MAKPTVDEVVTYGMAELNKCLCVAGIKQDEAAYLAKIMSTVLLAVIARMAVYAGGEKV